MTTAQANAKALSAKGSGRKEANRKAPRAGPISAFPTNSTLQRRPFARSSPSDGTSAGSMVCAALSRKTSAHPMVRAATIRPTNSAGFETPVSGVSGSGMANQTAIAAVENAKARRMSIARINRRRSTLSVTMPAGTAKTNQGRRSATGRIAINKGSRVSSVAIHAQRTVATPSARFVSPLAAINRERPRFDVNVCKPYS